MNSRQKKVIRISALVLGVVLLLFIAGYALRKPLLRKALDKASEKFEARTGMNLTYGNVDMSGLSYITLDSLKISDEGETVFTADKMYTKLKWSNILVAKVRPEEFIMNNAHLYYTRGTPSQNSDTSEPDSLSVRTASADTTATSAALEKILSLNYKKYMDEAFDAAFNYIPESITIDSLIADLSRDSTRGRVVIEDFRKDGAPYKMLLSLFEGKNIQTYKVDGTVNEDDKLLSFNLELVEGENELPLIEKLLDTKASLTSMKASFKQKDVGDSRTNMVGKISVEGFSVLNEDVSVERIVMDKLEADVNFSLGDQFIMVDSSSHVVVNKIDIPFYFSYGRYGDRDFAVAVPETTWDANDFFASLPPGLFNTFQGMEATGNIKYSLLAKIDPKKPETLVFDSSMDGKNLKITKYGREDYRKINGTFTQKAYVRGELDRTFTVSPGGSNYTPIGQVSPYLIDCILTAEDGGFWSHNGFNEDAFRKSFITNLQDSNFTRGGSTITMQLVKNVYLSKRKTIGRKVEEAMIVWLIEELGLVSKRQMMQTYLNIIEWGPHIYGITEASDFYFGKHPGDLTLAESLFLTSIIPKPRKARYSFESSTGKLRSYHEGYFNLLTDIMLRRNQLTQDDTAGLRAEVYLTESAYARLGLPVAERPEEKEEKGLFKKLFSNGNNIPLRSGF
ncbi:MAG: biosynthetic peptidoglycan transglycosylase [Cyclobacteriaceae bacterium]